MANRIAGITVEIGGDTTKLSSALKSVNSEIKTTQTQLKDVNSLLKLDPTNTELLTQKQRDLTKEISNTEEKLETLKTAAEQANEQLANGEITQEQYDALQREIIATEQDLKDLADQAAESNATLQKLDAVGDTMEKVGDKVSSVGKTLTKTVTAAVAAAATAAVTVTANFEQSMSKVEALISSSSDDIEGDMDKLEKKAREAGETTKFSATEAADAMSYMGLAGWDADQMIDGLDGILNLAAASEMDLATASDIVTDYLTAFGMEASQSGELVDIMTYAMSNSNTTTEQLGEAYKNCATTATQLGWDVDDVSAALMVMADNGSKGGEAGTALNSIMTRLANNTSGCADILHDYGIEVYDDSGMLNDLGDILLGMQDVWGDLNDEEKANLAYKVAGKNAESELMAVLGDSTGSLAEYTEGLNNCSGTAEEMADIMQDNLAGQLTILKSQLQELAISFGEILMPVIKKIVEWIQNFVDKLNNMDEGTKETITKIGLLVAAIGPLLTIVGKLISKTGSALKSISKFGTGILKVVGHAQTGTGAIGKLVTAIGGISAPAAIAVAGVGALVGAFVTLWKTDDDFRDNITGTWGEIKEKVGGFVDGLRERFEELGITLPSLGDIVNALKDVWMGFCEVLAPVFEGAFSVISDVLGTILDVILGILDVFIGLFTGDWEQMWEGVKEIFGGIWDGIVNIFTDVTDMLKNIADVVLGWFGTSWEEVWGNIKDFFVNIWNGIVDFFSNIQENIQNIASTVWNAITSFFSNILSNIKDFFVNIWNGIKDFFSNTSTNIQNVATTVWNAISSFFSTVLNGIKNVFSTVWSGIKTTVTTVWNNIKSTTSTVWNGIKSTVSTLAEGIKSKVTTAWNNIKTNTSTTWNTIKSTVSNIWDNMKSAVSSKVSNIYTTIRDGFNQAADFVKNMAKEAFQWGKDLINNIVDGIKNCIGKVKDACSNVASTIKSFLHFSVPDEGPLVDFESWMPDFIGGLAEGIENSRGLIQRAMEHVTSDMSVNPTLALATAGGGNGASGSGKMNNYSLGGVNIVINGYNAKNDDELARTVADKINTMISEDNSVFK